MTKVILNKWNGGQAEDIRVKSINKHEYSQNFNLNNEFHRLQAYPNSTEETVASSTMDNVEISDVTVCKVVATNVLVGAGYLGTSNILTFWIKNGVSDTWQAQASASGNSYVKGTLINYKSQAYAVDSNGSGTFRLVKYISAGTVSNIGNITAPLGSNVKCIVHPEDNILYVFAGNVIAKYDGTTFSTVSSILPAEYNTASVSIYAGYIAIGMNPLTDTGNPVCLLWGRDTTINTLQGSIDLGEGFLGVVENLHNNLFFIMSSGNRFSTTIQNRILIKGYAGGSVENILEIPISDSNNILHVKAKKNNRVYFGFRNSDCIWSFGKNRDGNYTAQQEIFIRNGEKISGLTHSQLVYGISIIGDVFWIATTSQSGVFTLQRTTINSSSYSATSIYKTTINPNMQEYDWNHKKMLKSAKLLYTGANSGSVVLKYSVDGGAMVSIFNQPNTAGEKVLKTLKQLDQKAFLQGYEFDFQLEVSGNAKVKSIEYIYEVIKTEM